MSKEHPVYEARCSAVERDRDHRPLILGQSFLDAVRELANDGLHFVCFTGDLADWAQPEEYARAAGQLEKLLNAASVPRDRLLLVPGNHDVDRGCNRAAWNAVAARAASSRDEVGKWMRGLPPPAGLDPAFREQLLERTQRFWDFARRFTGRRFSRVGHCKLGYRETFEPGELPGIITPVHVAGFDSAWLSGSDGEAKKLLLTDEQVLAVATDQSQRVPGFSLGLMHHPLGELADTQRATDLLANYVDLLLHGHQHEPLVQEQNLLGARLCVLAAGCLVEGDALKDYPNEMQRVDVHLDPAGRPQKYVIRFRQWAPSPRVWVKGTGIHRAAPDGELVWQVLNTPAAHASSAPNHRDLGPPPPWPENEGNAFVGRSDLIARWRAALESLTRPSATGRLVWVHGFGGMGKTSLLLEYGRIARERGDVAVGLIDWDVRDLHRPAQRPPHSPTELFDAVAYRIAQIHPQVPLDAYWQVRDEANRHHVTRAAYRQSLREALMFVMHEGLAAVHRPAGLGGDSDVIRRGRELVDLLRRRPDWREEGSGLRALLRRLDDELAFERTENDLLTEWIRGAMPTAAAALLAPGQLLSETLKECIDAACHQRPTVLVFDTCEVLFEAASYLDEWLMHLVAPLIQRDIPLLVTIGSRFPWDHAADGATTVRWRESISAMRREQADLSREEFTLRDLQDLLRLHAGRGFALPASPELPHVIMRATSGLPLAVGALLAAHADPGCPSPLNELLENGEREFEVGDDENDATEIVYARVAKRFLRYLENRPEDLTDIVGLALLQRSRRRVLGRVWHLSDADVRERLTVLSRRYGLFNGYDLHAVVRRHLRAHWRNQPPACLQAVAQRLAGALDQIQPPQDWSDEGGVETSLERIGIASWLAQAGNEDELACLVIRFVAHRGSTYELETLFESEDLNRRLPGTGRLINAWSRQWGRALPNSEASTHPFDSDGWSDFDRGCLHVVLGLFAYSQEDWVRCTSHLEGALATLNGKIPRKDEVAAAYFDSVAKGSSKAKAADALAVGERCGLVPTSWSNGYYWMLHNAARYDEAERYLRRVLAADTRSTEARSMLSHVLHAHLGRTAEAGALMREGLAARPDDLNLNYFYAQILEADSARAQDALDAYRRCLGKVIVPAEVNRIRRHIVELELRLDPQSEGARREVLQIRPADDATSNNSIAWLRYKVNVGLEEAEQFARRAHALSPDNINILHTLAALLMRRGNWDGARDIVARWLSELPPEDLIARWLEFGPLFQDAIAHGFGESLADEVSVRAGEPWAYLAAALRAAAARRLGAQPPLPIVPTQLVAQLLDGSPLQWPIDAPVAARTST
jgi:tetratricopeptide (TPR) repeat protein/calcineurin-like phosphoesterase family protein